MYLNYPSLIISVLLCVNWLRVLSALTDEQKGGATLAPSSKLTFLAGAKDAPLLQILHQMASAPEKWGPMIGSAGILSIPALEQLLETAIKTQK
jgi:hypothetical protein